MISGAQLLEGLRQVGTGETHLKVAIEAVRRNKDVSAAEVVNAMEMDLIQSPAPFITRTPRGTIEKARHLASGKPIDVLLGSPPKHSEENRIKAMAREIGEQVAEKLDIKITAAKSRTNALPPGTGDKDKVQH